MDFIRKNFFILLCTTIIIISFLIAFLTSSSQIGFYYDQARDAYQAYSIWYGHHLKILGPPTDVPGIYHGVLWYYFLALIYLVANNNVVFAVGILTFLTYLSVPLGGYVAYKITKNSKIAFLSMSLYSIAPLFLNFSHWISNPTPTIFIAPFLLYSLWQFVNKQKALYASIVGFLFGLMIQFDFAFLPLLLIIPLYYYLLHLKVRLSDLIFFLLSLFIATSTFFIASVKFHSNLLGIIVQRFFTNSNLQASVTSAFLGFIDSIIQFLSITYICLPIIISAIVLIWIFMRIRKSRVKYFDKGLLFLLTWTLGIVILFAINHGDINTIFFFAPILLSTSIIISYLIFYAFPQEKYLIVIVLTIFGLQLFKNVINLSSQSSYLVIQPGMIYSDETKVIDYTYQEASGKPFTINAITNPLYIATTWSYLYEFYGNKKYGYMPYWGGKDQVGQINSLKEIKGSTPLRFLIYEPTSIIPPIWVTKIVYEENKISDVVSTKEIGQFNIEKRTYDPSKKPPEIPEVLLKDKAVLDF